MLKLNFQNSKSIVFIVTILSVLGCDNNNTSVGSGDIETKTFAISVKHSEEMIDTLAFDPSTTNTIILHNAYRVDVDQYGFAPMTYYLRLERLQGDIEHLQAAYETMSPQRPSGPRFNVPELWMETVRLGRYVNSDEIIGFLKLVGYGLQPNTVDHGYYLFTADTTDVPKEGVFACSIHSIDNPTERTLPEQIGPPLASFQLDISKHHVAVQNTPKLTLEARDIVIFIERVPSDHHLAFMVFQSSNEDLAPSSRGDFGGPNGGFAFGLVGTPVIHAFEIKFP